MYAVTSAPAAIRRGTIVSDALSSALSMMALPSGARPSPQGQSPPVVTAAIMAIASAAPSDIRTRRS